MDCESLGSVALLAVQPKYASLLMQGSKSVEFRKVKFKEDVSIVVVYASSPICKVLGFFSVRRIVTDTPQALWESFNEVGGISKDEYDHYYNDSSGAVAIIVDKVTSLDNPLSLAELNCGAPPQSFLYLMPDQFAILLREAQA